MNEQNPILSQEEADKKTKELGVKIYSTEELAERQIKSAKRNSDAFRFFLSEVAKAEGSLMIDQLTEAELEKAFKDPVNNVYNFVRDNGGTINDFEKVMKNIQMLAYLFERAKNTAALAENKAVYAMIGENSLKDVPIKTLENVIIAKDIAEE